MTKKTARLGLDVILTVLLIAEMLYSVTGNAIHEVLGLVFCLGISAHLLLSASWIRSTARGIVKKSATKRSVSLAVMAAVLLTVMVALVVSSVAISRLLGGANDALTALLPYSTWYAVHVVSSYGLCALVLVHLVMHWQLLAKWLSVPYNPQRRALISNCANAVVGVGIVALCVSCAHSLDFSSQGPRRSRGGVGSRDEDGSELPDSDEGRGFGRGRHRGPAGEGQEFPPSTGEAVPDSFNENSQGGNNGSVPEDGGSSSEYCTLCRKHCLLSAPKCDRPYQEGLL